MYVMAGPKGVRRQQDESIQFQVIDVEIILNSIANA